MKKLILTFAVILAFGLEIANYAQSGGGCAPGCRGQLQACLAPYNINVIGNSAYGMTITINAGNKGGPDNTAAILACIDEYNVCKIACPSAPTLYVTVPPALNTQLL